MMLLFSHPGHGMLTGHFHLTDNAAVFLIAATAIALVLMTRGEK